MNKLQAPDVNQSVKKKVSRNQLEVSTQPHIPSLLHSSNNMSEDVERLNQNSEKNEHERGREKSFSKLFAKDCLVSHWFQPQITEPVIDSNVTSSLLQNSEKLQLHKQPDNLKQVSEQPWEISSVNDSHCHVSLASKYCLPNCITKSAHNSDSVIIDGLSTETKPPRRDPFFSFSLSVRVDVFVLLLAGLVLVTMYGSVRLQMRVQNLEDVLMRCEIKHNVDLAKFPAPNTDVNTNESGQGRENNQVDHLFSDTTEVKHSPTQNIERESSYDQDIHHENNRDTSTGQISVFRYRRASKAKSSKSKKRKKMKMKKLKRSVIQHVDQYLNNLHSKIDRLRDFMVRTNTYQATFFDLVEYKQLVNLPNKNCIAYKGDTNIQACKASKVKLKKEGSRLPFYQSMNLTQIEDKIREPPQAARQTDGGRSFEILMPGVYMVSANITVVDETYTKFLAIYLNDKAMFVCPNGGFVCPEANYKDHQTENITRICNMGGVLHLTKGDILQVRTMKPDMTLRVLSDRSSIFNLIRLYGKQDEKTEL